MSKWTQHDDDIIRDAYSAGERISAVAERMGWTRNQIIGRARVLGLSMSGRQLNSPYSVVNTHYPMSPEGRAAQVRSVREWNEANPDKVAAREAARREALIEWRKKNPERVKEIARKAREAYARQKNAD